MGRSHPIINSPYVYLPPTCSGLQMGVGKGAGEGAAATSAHKQATISKACVHILSQVINAFNHRSLAAYIYLITVSLSRVRIPNISKVIN